jgi:hypothetical protein
MRKRSVISGLVLGALATAALTVAPAQLQPALSQPAPSLEAAFRNPPREARPWTYYLLLNGYVNRAHVETELRDYWEKGFGGLCIFDMGARGDKSGLPPAGPPFLSRESAEDIAHVIRTAGSLGMETDLSVASSWDLGGDWVKPEDASMTLLSAEMDVRGPARIAQPLPMPALPPETPRSADGKPLFLRNVATLAIPNPERLPGHIFVLQVEKPWPQQIVRVALYNTRSGETQDAFAKDFLLEASEDVNRPGAFREVLRGTLKPVEGPQEFPVTPVAARYLRLTLLNGHNPSVPYVQLAEFEAYAANGRNVALSHRVNREIDGADLVQAPSSRGQLGAWAAANIHDGVKSGGRGSWSSAGLPPLHIPQPQQIVDLSERTAADGTLSWDAPDGAWKIIRYVVTNTGERLKVPSPHSDGLATDHFNEHATLRYIREVVARLKPVLGDLSQSALKELYLASYEVRGNVWTPAFLAEFEKRRGYALTPFLPALSGSEVGDEEATRRVLFDFRKTQGELLVDAYYRAAARAAREAGLGIESEAGGPGPPIHNVPVDALLANSAIDSVRGEFWPYRPQADGLWVIKETASAAHVYGKPLVAMEAFTSVHHWEEGPQDLKDAADRAFCEGMNHVVWHTAAHLPPEAGKPGWVYGAGTHLNPNVPWWPMARPFLDYLARASYLLRQGRFVADVLYYYGDGGYKFVPPKHIDPSLGFGYDYDVANSDILLNHATVQDSRVVLKSGMRYEVLVLPEDDAISLEVLEQLERLVEAGATIVGPRPQRVHGYRDHASQDAAVRELAARLWGDLDGRERRSRVVGKGRVVWGMPLWEVLRERGVLPDLAVLPDSNGKRDSSAIDFVHRTTPEAEIYFVRNKSNQPLRWEGSFRVAGKLPEFWDPMTGSTREAEGFVAVAGRTQVPVRLAPMGSTFVVFRKKAPGGLVIGAPPAPARSSMPVREVSVDATGPWIVRFPAGAGASERITMPELRPLTTHAESSVRHFAGVADFETVVDVPSLMLTRSEPVTLELGDLWAVAEVFVNDTRAGVVWARPFSIDVTTALKPGPNRLRIRIANNWINRLVGDATVAPGQRTTRTNITTNTPRAIPWKDVPLRPSGLLGPVRLVTRANR